MGVSRKKAFVIALFGAIIIGATCWFIFLRDVEPLETRMVTFSHVLPNEATHYSAYEGRLLFRTQIKAFEPVSSNRIFEWSFVLLHDSRYNTYFTFRYYREIAQDEYVYTDFNYEEVSVEIFVGVGGQVIWDVT